MKRKQIEALLKIASEHGAKIVNGKKHIKVFASDGRYICSFSHGGGGFEGPNDGRWYLRMFHREGWL